MFPMSSFFVLGLFWLTWIPIPLHCLLVICIHCCCIFPPHLSSSISHSYHQCRVWWNKLFHHKVLMMNNKQLVLMSQMIVHYRCCPLDGIKLPLCSSEAKTENKLLPICVEIRTFEALQYYLSHSWQKLCKKANKF